MRATRAVVACGAVLIGIALPSLSDAVPEEKVTICHSTNSVQNPYVQETVNADSIVMPDGTPTGHGDETAPVYPAEPWGDIIPPFTYTDTEGQPAQYSGLNWINPDGKDVFDAGCLVDLIEPPPEQTTTTTEETTTTTEPPTSSTTTSTTLPLISTSTTLPPTSTSTTLPPSTTSTTFPSSTTSTTLPPVTPPTQAPAGERPPPLTAPAPGVETMPPTEAEAIGPGGDVKDLGQLSPHERERLEAEYDAPPLAYTGQNIAQLAALGAVLAVAGFGLVVATRPRRRAAHRRLR